MPKHSYTTIPLAPAWGSSCDYCDYKIVDKPLRYIQKMEKLHHKLKHPDKPFIKAEPIETEIAKNGDCKKILEKSIMADRLIK